MLVPLLLLALATFGATAPEANPAAPVLSLVTRCEAKCRTLSGRLQACRAAGQDIAYPDAALAVAELFCRYSRYDAGRPELCAAALRSMQYVDGMLDAELRKAEDALAGRARYPSIPQSRTLGVTWHDGGFWSGRTPIFLSGLNWDAVEAQHDPALLKRLGMNLSDGMLRGETRPDGSFDDAGFHGGDGQYMDQMARSGFPVDCLFGIGLPRSMVDATPGLAQTGFANGCDYDLEHPVALRHRDACLDHFVPLYAAQPSFLAVDLANEPAFQGPSERTLESWRAWLKRKYGDLAALNRAWGTHLESFDAIRRFPSQPERMTSQWDRARVDFSQPGMRGMHYDWCAFNNERVSDYFRSVSDRIHASAPRVATHVKAMLGGYFTGSTEARGWGMDLSYHTFGIDPEALARFCNLLGGDLDLGDLSHVEKPNRRFGSVPYVCAWLDAGLAADFMKSLAPEKPFYDSEFHVTEDNKPALDPEGAREHVVTALWLAHLHGMCANLAWYWSRDAGGAPTGVDWFTGSMLQQPWMLQGYAQESLSLRRFVRPVMAFARQPRPVRLLYSEASAIQDVHYLDALRDAYEALNFLGASIGLVTERQLAEGGLPGGTRLLVVPNARYVQDQTVPALRAWRSRGVAVAIIGDESLAATPTGRQREDREVAGAKHAPIGSPQEYHVQLDAWMRAAGIRRELLALDAGGRPAWGIEVRAAREGRRRLAYLVNLLRQPARVTLQWRVPGARLHDWRGEAMLGKQVLLAPRQVVFGAS